MVRVSTERWLTPARIAAVVPASFVALAGSACGPGTRAAKPAVAPRASAGRVRRACRASRPSRGSGAHPDCPRGPAFQGRPAGARPWPRRGRPCRVRQGRERAAGVALRRPDRAAHSRVFRSARRPDQRLRGQGPRGRGRVHREAVRAGVDRRAAGGVGDLHARPSPSLPCRRRSRATRSSTISRSRSIRACSRSSRSSRGGCTTSSRKGCSAGRNTCR